MRANWATTEGGGAGSSHTGARGGQGGSWGRVLLGLLLTVTVAGGGLLVVGTAATASAAATAPAVTQCDPPATPTGAGYQVSCTVAVVNTVSSTGGGSTVTTTACLAAAGVLPPSGCVSTETSSDQLATSVDQCNGVAYGGGSNVVCSVTVTDDVPSGTSIAAVTVDQCVGSGAEGGTQPTLDCAPTSSVTGAGVTQCNG